MSLFLSRLRPNLALAAVRRDLADGQQLHRTILSAFDAPDGVSPRAELGVLHRLDARDDGPELLVQSGARPDWGRLAPGWSVEPVQVRDIDPLLAQLKPGSRYLFRLLANPTKERSRRDEQGTLVHLGRAPLVTEEDRRAWIERKAATAGCAIVELLISEPVGARTVAYGAGRPRAFVGARFDGLLEVRDPDLLAAATRGGIGRGRAYGYGLLSLASPRFAA